MKLQRARFAGSKATALELPWAIALMSSLSLAVGCGGGSSDEASAVGGGTSENAGGEGGTNSAPMNDDEPLTEDGLAGMGATGGREDLAAAGTGSGAGGSAAGTGSSTGCAALPRRAIRFSRDMETSQGASCGLWALSIVPEGTGNAYVLARAERDPANVLRTIDATVVLRGPVVASTCVNTVPQRQAIFAGAGLGPSPFLETNLSADYSQLGNLTFANVTIDTHLLAGAVTCAGQLPLEQSY
jgi:hypothetical protein